MYTDRVDAGRRLAKVLRHLKGKDTVVLALPRGGIVLGAEVAKELRAPLGLVLVKKIGHPTHPEYAVGAIAKGEAPIYNSAELTILNKQWLARAVESARELVEYRRDLYYGRDFTPPDIKDKVVIIVDDGIATGLTMEAAVRSMKNKQARRIIVAAPIASSESVDTLEKLADEVVILETPDDFLGAVGGHYLEFEQVDDDEVRTLLREARF